MLSLSYYQAFLSQGHAGGVNCILVTDDEYRKAPCMSKGLKPSKFLFSGGDDSDIRIYNLESSQCVGIYSDNARPIKCLATGRVDFNCIKTASSRILPMSPKEYQIHQDNEQNIKDDTVYVSPTEKQNKAEVAPRDLLFAGCKENGVVVSYDIQTFKKLVEYRAGAEDGDSLDVNAIVVNAGNHLFAGYSDGKITIFEAQSGIKLKSIIKHTGAINQLVLSGTDIYHAANLHSCGEDGILFSHDLVGNKSVQAFKSRHSIVYFKFLNKTKGMLIVCSDGIVTETSTKNRELSCYCSKVVKAVHYGDDKSSFLLCCGTGKALNDIAATATDTSPDTNVVNRVDLITGMPVNYKEAVKHEEVNDLQVVDGKLLFAASPDGSIHGVTINSRNLVIQLRSYAYHSLSGIFMLGFEHCQLLAFPAFYDGSNTFLQYVSMCRMYFNDLVEENSSLRMALNIQSVTQEMLSKLFVAKFYLSLLLLAVMFVVTGRKTAMRAFAQIEKNKRNFNLTKKQLVQHNRVLHIKYEASQRLLSACTRVLFIPIYQSVLYGFTCDEQDSLVVHPTVACDSVVHIVIVVLVVLLVLLPFTLLSMRMSRIDNDVRYMRGSSLFRWQKDLVSKQSWIFAANAASEENLVSLFMIPIEVVLVSSDVLIGSANQLPALQTFLTVGIVYLLLMLAFPPYECAAMNHVRTSLVCIIVYTDVSAIYVLQKNVASSSYYYMLFPVVAVSGYYLSKLSQYLFHNTTDASTSKIHDWISHKSNPKSLVSVMPTA